MNYSKIQKLTSITLIFFILCSFTFQIPIGQLLLSKSAYADDLTYDSLVSIIVTEDIYDEVKSNLNVYAQDIQGYLPTTKTVIIPVPETATPHEIASINEKLYFEGYWQNKFQSKLIWTVLVWDIPLPVVFDGGEAASTILPYTDFEKKSYVYSFSRWKYIKNTSVTTRIEPEIWHGVISPNTWDFNDDVEKIKDYFNKNHDYYTDSWIYTGEIKWANEPFVFYFDSVREYTALSYFNYKAYNLGLKYLEHLTYHRYTKELATLIQDEYMANQNEAFPELSDLENMSWMEMEWSPDAQVRFVIQKLIKKFPEVINSSVVWDMQKDVYNAWRYNKSDAIVNVDMIPTIIGMMDDFAKEVILDANDDLEEKINRIVEDGLSRKIPIYVRETLTVEPQERSDLDVSYKLREAPYTTYLSRPADYTSSKYIRFSSWEESLYWNAPWTWEDKIYTNFIRWRPAAEITSADQCSLFRGTNADWWKRIIANRWYNVNKIENDVNHLKAESNSCLINKEVQWRYWWNTPLNLEMIDLSQPQNWTNDSWNSFEWNPRLWEHNTRMWIIPLFDINWTVKSTWGGTVSPYNCYTSNFTVTTKYKYSIENVYEWWDEVRWYTVNIPTNWTPKRNTNWWNCEDPLPRPTWVTRSFFNYDNIPDVDWWCYPMEVYIDGNMIYSETKNCPIKTEWYWDGSYQYRPPIRTTHMYFKTIPSIIKHVSPTRSELEAIIANPIIQDLPVDVDRYVDFISAKGDTVKIKYPYLFRFENRDNEILTLETSKLLIKRYLDEKSEEINQVIRTNYSALPWDLIYLKTWNYPEADTDLYWFLNDKWWTQIESAWRTKEITYIDTLALAIYWNNLWSIESKYKFVLENHLTDQFEVSTKYILPNNKALYEVAYLKAKWNAESMYIKMDPEDKWENPYSEELSEIAKIAAATSYASISAEEEASNHNRPSGSSNEWSIIWEWFQEIVKWITTLPDSIWIESWTCSSSPPEEKSENLEWCFKDDNKNWIIDCLEQTTKIEVLWNSRLFVWEVWEYEANLLMSDWIINYSDNDSILALEVQQIQVPFNKEEQISLQNIQTVYDINDSYRDESIISKYLSLPSSGYKVSSWKIWFSMIAWNNVANIKLKAIVTTKSDEEGNDIIRESDSVDIRVRTDKLEWIIYSIDNSTWDAILSASDAIEVSDTSNIYLFDNSDVSLRSDINRANSLSASSEKLFIWVSSVNNRWAPYPIEYPLSVRITDEELNEVYSQDMSSIWTSTAPYVSLWAYTKAGKYNLIISDNKWDILEKEVVLLPWEIDKIDIKPFTNTIESGWVITDNAIFIRDKFDNLVKWRYFDVEVKIDWDSIRLADSWFVGQESRTIWIFEWIWVFKLKSTDANTISNITVSYTDEELNIVDSKQIEVMEDINFEFTFPWTMEVWFNSYNFSVTTTNAPNFSWIAYVRIPEEYWVFEDTVYIENWSWSSIFTTSKIAWKDIPWRLQVSWVREEKQFNFEVKPGLPVKLWMFMDRDTVEVWTSETVKVRAEIQDMYSNVTYNVSGKSIDFEILEKYSWIINVDQTTKVANEWVATFIVTPSSLPWSAYIKMSVRPWLSGNSFEVDGETYYWYWVAVWKISNVFKLRWKNISNGYNSIYTTLIWAEYWDYTNEWYLAWDLIFDPNSKALAVTSLTTSGIKKNTVLSLSSWWNIEAPDTNDLSQYLTTSLDYSETQKLKVNIINKSSNNFVWSVLYNLSDAPLNICGVENWNIASCVEDKWSLNWIYIKAFDSWTVEDAWDELTLYGKDWNVEVQLDNNLHIYSLFSWNILSVSENNSNDFLLLEIKNVFWVKKAEIAILNKWNTFFSRDGSVEPTWRTILSLSSYNYSLSRINLWDTEKFMVSYNDPFTNSETYSSFSKKSPWGYEFYKKDSLWWADDNQSLLAYSAWDNVWESTMKYASFGLINIWDPVIWINKEEALTIVKETNWEERPFDSTVWKLIWNFEDFLDYEVFDYNWDNKEDIVVFTTSWKIYLYENYNGTYIDRWYLANIFDVAWDAQFITWDFFWDWFEDIVFISSLREVSLLNNDKKDFYRVDISEKLGLDWLPLSIDWYDMDNDWVDDLVILDDSWEIHIFYWNHDGEIEFTKLKVAEWYALSVDWSTMNINGAMYFEWLYEEDSPSDWSQPGADTWSSDVMNSILYYTMPYLEDEDYVFDTSAADIPWIILPAQMQKPLKNTNFLRSKYLSTVDIDYRKKYIDRNGGALKPWDIVDVELTIESSRIKNWVALIEKFPAIFEKIDDFTVVDENGDGYDVKPAPQNSDGFEFLIEIPTMQPDRSYNFYYSVITSTYEYWAIEAWDFEKGEVWEDPYGDILYSIDPEACSKKWVLFRSSGARWYTEWDLPVSCWDANLPEELLTMSTDEDANGIPDSVDELYEAAGELVNWWDAEWNDFTTYAQNQMAEFARDLNWDGLDNDFDVNIISDFSRINEGIDNVSERMIDLAAWFRCWFGVGCFPVPFNWAPLAPWNDPVFLWREWWDGRKVNEGIPIFAFPTTGPVTVFWAPIPPFWPVNYMWAGWIFTWESSTIRVFVTPTLTWWVWTAVCFWNNQTAWIQPITWPYPLGWNCIVVAKKGALCWWERDADWNISDGSHVWVVFPYSPVYTNWSYGIFDWSCKKDSSETDVPVLPNDVVEAHLNWESELTEEMKNLFGGQTHTVWGTLFKSWKLWNMWWEPTKVLSWSSDGTFKYQEPEIIKNIRIDGFPNFLMPWLTAQIEEAVTKLFDFPRLIVVLPDVDGLLDAVKDLDIAYSDEKQKVVDEAEDDLTRIVERMAQIDEKLIELAKSWERTSPEYINLEKERAELHYIKTLLPIANAHAPSIKAVYEFVWKLPAVTLNEEMINIKLPYITDTYLFQAIAEMKSSMEQRTTEIIEAKVRWWSFLLECEKLPTENVREQCRDKYNVSLEVLTNFDQLINQVDRNIQILESYKDLPKDVYELLNTKEKRIDQIICNIEIITELISGWIKRNWKIFKSWVELYLTIKAILRSWQVMLDIFYGYEEQCKECKNERYDLIWLDFSVVFPTLPVIEFPKIPDVIFDVHNIRAWISITIPNFDIQLEPLTVPSLPKLYLPEVPDVNFAVNFKLPEIGLLPEISLPELPDIPSLDKPIIPDLPPAPTLPPLPSSITGFLNILKLITSLACLQRYIPLVPENRAWSHIAFLTENPWFLNIHFAFDFSLPKISFSYIDAIKISTYINLEWWDLTESIVKNLKQSIENSVNWIWSNLVNKLSGWVEDWDYRWTVPWTLDLNVDVNITEDWVNTNTTWNLEWDDSPSDLLNYGPTLNHDFALQVAKKFQESYNDLHEASLRAPWSARDVVLTINEELSAREYAARNELEPLRWIWAELANYNYAKEDDVIQELLDFNDAKFNYVISVLENERAINAKQKEAIGEFLKDHNKDRLISSLWNQTSRIKAYNEWLAKYNNVEFVNDLNYENSLEEESHKFKEDFAAYKEKSAFFASASSLNNWNNSCPASWDSFDRVIEWIYINKDNKNYRLFDYIDNYSWGANIRPLDYDSDSDEDLLYEIDWAIYLKTNQEKKWHFNVYSSFEVDTGYYAQNIADNNFIPSVNSFEESSVEANYTNLEFDSIDKEWISNYRFEAHKLVDKFGYSDWIPENLNKRKIIVDMFTDIDSITLREDDFVDDNTVFRHNLWTFQFIPQVSGYKIKTRMFESIANKLTNGIQLSISQWTYIYTWNSSATIWVERGGEVIDYSIPANSNIEFIKTVNIVSINGSAYLALNAVKTYDSSEAHLLHWMPILPWTKIIWDETIDDYLWIVPLFRIMYYDWSRSDFSLRTTTEYEVYDLWKRSRSYNVRLSRENDYYYSKIYAFNWELNWTYSRQALMSPQNAADTTAPDIFLSRIEVPVYKYKDVNLNLWVYEESWLDNLDIFIDVDIEGQPWDSLGDRDVFIWWWMVEGIELKKVDDNLILTVWPYDSLFTKEVRLYAIDNNWNRSIRDIQIVCYSPTPNIADYQGNLLSWQLDAVVEWEPITLFRYRHWTVNKVEWEEVEDLVSIEWWRFEVEWDNTKWASLTMNDQTTEVAIINEETWKINFIWSFNYSDNTRILPTGHPDNDSDYPIVIVTVDGQEIYKQHISLPDDWSVRLVQNFNDLVTLDVWAHVTFYNQWQYALYAIPSSVPINPWAAVLYDSTDEDKIPIITVMRDWRVIVHDDSFELKLSSNWEYLIYKIVKWSVDIAWVLLKPLPKSIIK